MDQYKIIQVKESVFADNDREADRVRQQLKGQGTFLLNLMSSPGSGKTTTLLRTVEGLKDQLRIGVMEADIDSDVDAAAMAGAGVRSIQLHTGGMCHLDAGMTEQGLQELGTEDLDLVVLETNLPEESIRWLCDNCKAPILADPVSTIKAEKLRPVLGKLSALKPNRLEAELLSGMPIRTREDAAQAARRLLDTGLGKCRMCVAAKADFRDGGARTLRVATKFPRIARDYYSSLSRDIDIIKLNGSIELAPILGLSDVIVDIVETGTTLRENNLAVLEEFMPISARFIANKASYKFKYQQMSTLLEKMKEALAQ